MLTTIDPTTHHYNSSTNVDSIINIVDQLIEAAPLGHYPARSPKDRKSLTVSTRDGIPRSLDSIRNASAKALLNFETFSIGFAIEHPEVDYRLIGDPHITFERRFKTCIISQRLELTHTFDNGKGQELTDVAVVAAHMVLAQTAGRGSVIDFIIGAEMTIEDKGKGYTRTCTGEDAQKLLGTSPRFTIFADELLHMYVKCDSRVFTPMTADKMVVETLVSHGKAKN